MKNLRVVISVLMLLGSGLLFANGQDETGNSEKKELSFMINFQATEAVTAAFEEVVAEFNAENENIEVELMPGTSDYEALMKTKMAANQLPDLFTTHGWSVLRYSEYLMPLEDQEWANRLHPAIEPVITDSNGHIFVLPLDVDMAGIAYNKTVVEAAGIDVAMIKTWKDMFDAMEILKNSGVTPVHIGGKDNWPVGNFFDWAAPSVFVTDESNYSGDDLLSGRFDSDKWDLLSHLVKDLNEKEYLNVDNLTSTYTESAIALAKGEAAFTFYGNYVLAEAWSYAPDADLGFFPVPAFYEGDEPSLVSGERTTVGIWKDTENEEAAKIFLAFLAKPENAAKIASSNAIPAGLTDAVSNTGKLDEDYKRWSNVSAFPYFDRAFLPSGMWDTLCSTGAGILSGSMTTDEATNTMLEDFNRLYNK